MTVWYSLQLWQCFAVLLLYQLTLPLLSRLRLRDHTCFCS